MKKINITQSIRWYENKFKLNLKMIHLPCFIWDQSKLSSTICLQVKLLLFFYLSPFNNSLSAQGENKTEHNISEHKTTIVLIIILYYLQYIIRYTADVGFKEGRSNDDIIEFGSETKCALRLDEPKCIHIHFDKQLQSNLREKLKLSIDHEQFSYILMVQVADTDQNVDKQ
ncbi:hypothetical protein AGLY_014282 [Aphis glycines]|uniref:Uncharacterized protein n=1 Tax=Aphis glycines TaxID=307491 RepID=A0A6G0T4V9_APHGL|nr:hypothetical protein AGLY_014282 [Aphis glycines]